MSDLETADDIAEIRDAFVGTAPLRATIQRNDGADNWPVVATDVPCRGWSDRAVEVVIAGEVRSVVPWLFNLPSATDIGSTDRLLVGGRTFEVFAAVDPIDQALIRQVRAVEVR